MVCPLTNDYDHFRDAVGQIDPKRVPADLGPESETASGTRIGAGLRHAAAMHDERFPGAQDIVLLSDGDDPARDGEWRVGVTQARDRGIRVHAIGLGNPEEGSPIPTENGPLLDAKGQEVRTRLEEEPLREIARLTGGSYVPAHARAIPWDELLRTRIETREARADGVDALAVYRQHYGWFLAAALSLLAGEMLLGRGRRKVAPSHSSPPVATGREIQS